MRLNIYVPEELGTAVKSAGLPVSQICQAALAAALVEEGGFDLEIALVKAQEAITESLQILREQT